MSASDLTEATSTRGFKPEFHSWILIPDTASFRKESSEEDPTNAPSHDGCPEATATSDEAPETSTVNAESIILGTTTIGGLCSSLPTSPLASSCDLSSSAGSELLIPSWPLALPRPCPGALEALEGVEREERIARVICYGGADADAVPDDVQLARMHTHPDPHHPNPDPDPNPPPPLVPHPHAHPKPEPRAGAAGLPARARRQPLRAAALAALAALAPAAALEPGQARPSPRPPPG